MRIAAALLFCLTASLVAADEDEDNPATLDELKAAIEQLVEERELPGAAIAMVDENGPVWVGGVGKANLENDIDADADTLFRIGSTSKMFVALAVLKLVEEGRLSLDDKLADLAPDVAFENRWEETHPIRVAHLLEHTTGWDDIHLPEYAHNEPDPVSLKEGLDFHPHSRISRWPPGSRSSYCNAGPPVAAYIVEKITGQDFEDYAREQFFEPLGMSSTTFRLNEAVRERGATLYANGNQPQDYWHILMRPSGAINSSANDMARLVAFFIDRGAVAGRQLLSPASITRMETPATSNAARIGQQAGYALANYSSVHEHWVYRAHDGGVNGGISEFAYLPEARVGHSIIVNSDDFRTFNDISDLIRDYETRELAAPETANALQPTAAHKAIEGYYYPINSRQQVSYFLDRVFGAQKLRFDGDKLEHAAVLGGNTTVFLAVADKLFASEKTGVIALSQAVDPLAGDVVHLGDMVLKPVTEALVYGQLGVAALWGICIISAVLYFLVWIVRKLRGKIPAGATIRVRLWPLLASLSIVAVVLLFAIGMSDPFELLGKPTWVSVGINLATVAFALFAAFGVHTSVKVRAEPMNRFNYWYSTVCSSTHLVVAAYLLAFGVIGLITWS